MVEHALAAADQLGETQVGIALDSARVLLGGDGSADLPLDTITLADA